MGGNEEYGFDYEAWKEKNYGGEIPAEILKGYKREDDYILFHEDDRDLSTIKIYLPVAPDLRLIDGWGKPAREQKFEYDEIPPRLISIGNQIIKDREAAGIDEEFVAIQEVWAFLTKNQGRYKKEIKWLRRALYRSIYGYWTFINGKPTFIDPDHYSYLNFNHIDIGRPHYRDRDRRWFLAVNYFENTTEAPFGWKAEWVENGVTHKVRYFGNEREAEEYEVLLANSNVAVSNYEIKQEDNLVDLGYRTVMGINYPKHRREGATNKSSWKILIRTLRAKNRQSGILSMDEAHSATVFKSYTMKSFRELPWFFKPEYQGSDDNKTALVLRPSGKRVGSRGAMAFSAPGLDSMLDYSKNASSAYYDGKKLYYLYEDECGKTVLRDVYAGHDQTKHCMGQGDGANMEGFTIKTSTVGEMEKKGGQRFYKLCQASHYDKRNSLGMTTTMLVTIFMPAYDGLEEFIGEYGESIIDTPTPEQAAFIGKDYGAKMHLKIKEMQLRASKDPDAMNDLNEFMRLHPTQYRDCFRRNTSDIGFNIAILNARINELMFTPTATQSGRFVYDENDLRVYWQEEKNGPWRNSLVLPPEETNRVVRDGEGSLVPENTTKFIISADPVKFMKTEHRRMSDFGGAGFINRNYMIDDTETPVEEWQTHRFILDYRDRPPVKADASKQILYAAMYYGCLVSPEINVTDTWDFFVTNGYEKFLYYFTNPATGMKKKTPGFNSQTGSKNDIFNAYRDYIELHGKRDMHERILNDCADIGGIEEMTDYDIFTAGGGCLISSSNMLPQESINGQRIENRDNDEIRAEEWYRTIF